MHSLTIIIHCSDILNGCSLTIIINKVMTKLTTPALQCAISDCFAGSTATYLPIHYNHERLASAYMVMQDQSSSAFRAQHNT